MKEIVFVHIMSEFKTGTRIKIETNIDIINELRAIECY